MKNAVTLILLLLILITSSFNSFAEIKFSNALAKDIGQAYGFFLGQNYVLNKISKKYPSLSGYALLAEKEFSAAFKPSIEEIDKFNETHIKGEWRSIKKQLYTQMPSFMDIEKISETQAYQFIEKVRERAKGQIDSPVLETLLLFKPSYENHPEREFLDGYKYKYATNGTGKAKEVAFSIEVPKTWVAKEAERPNIVQKFISENGRGLELLMILIKDMPLEQGEAITEKEISEILNSDGIQDFLPDGAFYINSGKLTLENLPGFWVQSKGDFSRVRNTISMESITYYVFYKNKMIQIQGQVMTSINGESTERGGLKKYERLFDIVANSFVILNLYN